MTSMRTERLKLNWRGAVADANERELQPSDEIAHAGDRDGYSVTIDRVEAERRRNERKLVRFDVVLAHRGVSLSREQLVANFVRVVR